MRAALLVVLVVVGCSKPVKPSPAPKPAAAAVPAAETVSPIKFGPTLAAAPTAWQVSVSGGPTALLTGGQLERGYREWTSPPGPVAYRVEVGPSGRLRLQVIEYGINRTWGAYGPVAAMYDIPGQGTWLGRTLDLEPVP